MKELDKFVDAWERTKNIEEIISQNLTLPAPEEVQSYLSSLPEDRHRKIRQSLDEALQALSSYTLQLEKDAGRLKTQIEQNIQVSNACLAYNKAPGKPSE